MIQQSYFWGYLWKEENKELKEISAHHLHWNITHKSQDMETI